MAILKPIEGNISIIDSCKHTVAQRKGYANWTEYFDWVCREGQNPEVVGQLIESATAEAYKLYIIELKKGGRK